MYVPLGKPDASNLPKNKEEAGKVIQMDMACLTEALITLIQAADQGGYKTLEGSIKDTITHVERAFDNTPNITVNSVEIKGDDGQKKIDFPEE